MQYFIDVVSFSLIYWLPALAFYPQLLRYPAYTAVLPILNVALVGVLTTGLLALGWFTTPIVRGCSVILMLIAVYRGWRYCQGNPPRWSLAAMETWGINFLLILPYAVHLGTTAFDSDDEIYSWNYWALQYVQGMLQVDFVHTTGVPYPQFFPKWIAYGYQWLGDTQLQLPLRATLAWFAFCTVQAITLLAKDSVRAIWLTRIGLLIVLYGTNVQRYFEIGYADPLMVACLLSSVALYCHSLRQSDPVAVWLSVISGITAAYTKQPGLYWVGFALPYCLWRLADPTLRPLRWKAIAVLWGAAVLWWEVEGRGFTRNTGVLHASFSGRTFGEQAWFAFQKYGLRQPVFLGAFLASAWGVYRVPMYRTLWYAWLLPSTLLWCFFGAYHLRLGVHNVLGAFLLCVAIDFPWQAPWLSAWAASAARHRKSIIATMFLIISSISGYLWYRAALWQSDAPNPLHSGEIALRKYFGAEWRWVYTHLYDNTDIVLWSPTDYIYGLFYSRTPILRPDYARYTERDLSIVAAQLWQELQENQVQYAFTLGVLPTYGAFLSEALEQLAREHPEAIVPVVTPPNRYHYTLYRLEGMDRRRD